MEKYTDKQKAAALADYLGAEVKKGESPNEYTTDSGRTYKVFTGAEADEAAKEYIAASLWAFNADFVLDHSEAANALSVWERAEAEEALQEMQAKLCESATPLVRCLIADLDEFIDDAVRADGRGHFIAQYDGDEIELGGDLYAYRID